MKLSTTFIVLDVYFRYSSLFLFVLNCPLSVLHAHIGPALALSRLDGHVSCLTYSMSARPYYKMDTYLSYLEHVLEHLIIKLFFNFSSILYLVSLFE